MPRIRDTQRSRVYAWEALAVQQLTGRSIHEPDFKTLDECMAFAEPIWRKERARVGLAGQRAPSIERPSWGQTSALAHASHKITLPKWARSRWVILHEMAHRLTPDRRKDAGHGPRFVGCLIGLASRWAGFDATLLMQLADEGGVAYHVRTVGVVPVRGLAWHLERLLRTEAPMTGMDLACHLSLADGVHATERTVRGAALALIKAGRARWLRGKLVPVGDLLPKVAEVAKPRPKKVGPLAALVALAKPHGIEVEHDGPGSYWVTVPHLLDTREDPLEGEHWACGYSEARRKVQAYIEVLGGQARAA